jgi:membrane protease YdiL (CAAX protease family)
MEQRVRHVFRFFAITFAQTWAFYLAIILLRLSTDRGLGMVFLICGGMAPSLIGVVMALMTYDRDGRREFFRRFYQLNCISVRWWLFILLIYPMIHLVAIGLTFLSGGEAPAMELLRSVIQNPASIVFVLIQGFFINGPWPEEFGWRGFALQPLLDRFGFVRANLLLGVVWALWHLPLFFMPTMGHYQMGLVGFWFFIAQAVGLSMMMAFVHVNTRQSIFAALLMHMMCNLTPNLMAGYTQAYERLAFSLVLVAGVMCSVLASVVGVADGTDGQAGRDGRAWRTGRAGVADGTDGRSETDEARRF